MESQALSPRRRRQAEHLGGKRRRSDQRIGEARCEGRMGKQLGADGGYWRLGEGFGDSGHA